MRLDHFYFLVSDVPKSIEFYTKLLDNKPTNVETTRWADWNDDKGIYFGIITKEAISPNKTIIGNNSVLGLFTDDIKASFEKAKNIGAKVIEEPYIVYESPIIMNALR